MKEKKKKDKRKSIYTSTVNTPTIPTMKNTSSFDFCTDYYSFYVNGQDMSQEFLIWEETVLT